jgi:ABC-type phosphate/phosphonate transport system permease subunit
MSSKLEERRVMMQGRHVMKVVWWILRKWAFHIVPMAIMLHGVTARG